MKGNINVMFPLSGGGSKIEGAVYYKGAVASASALPASPSQGDMYIASADFTLGTSNVESGDYLLYNGTGWDIVHNAYTGTKKSEIDDYIEDEKKPEIDAYIAQQAAQYDATAFRDGISALDKRVSNLEESLDVITEIDYPDATYGTGEVPPNKSKYAEVTKLRGVGRVANNLVNPADSSTSTVNGITFTNNGDGSWTVSGATGESPAQKPIVPYNMKANHSYLLAGARNNVILAYIGQSTDRVDEGSGIVATITTDTYKALFIYVRANVTLSSPVTIRPISTDLNVYFNTSDLSFLGATDSAKLATIQQNYPELLIPSDYDAGSLVSTTYSGVKSVGVNIWVEEWEVGRIASSSGTNADTGYDIRSKDYIPVFPSTTYYFLVPPTGAVFFYDYSKNFISTTGPMDSGVFSTPSNCVFIRFCTYSGSGHTTYNHDIQICLNSYADKTVYHPHMESTLTLPSPVTLKGAGSVADTDELNVKVDIEVDGVQKRVERRRQTQRVGQVDAGTLNWSYNGSYGFYVPLSSITNIKAGSYSASSELLCPTYTKSTQEQITAVGGTDMAMAIGIQFLYASNSKYSDATSFKASLSGVMLYYELATPVVTLLDPIPNPFIQVEGGGTIKPVQTNEPEIDSAMTVTYVNKITA